MMIKSLLVFAFLGAWISAQAGALLLDEDGVDFGEKYQFAELTHNVRLSNKSLQDIQIEDSKNTNGVWYSVDKAHLMSGESTVAHVKVMLADRRGSVSIPAVFETREGGKVERYRFFFRGFVDSVLDDPKPLVDFEVVDTKTAPTERAYKLASESDPSVRATKILETPEFVEARIGDEGRTVWLKPARFHDVGYRKGVVIVALDSAKQHKVSIIVSMDVHGNIVPDQNPLDLGLQRPSTRKPIRLQLASRDSTQFRVGNVTIEGTAKISTEETPCLPKSRRDCRAYLLTVKDDQGFGRILGDISIQLPDTGQVLHESITGMYLSDTTQVRSLNEILETGRVASQSPSGIDLSKSLKSAVEQPDAPPPGIGPLLKWQVANEGGMYGYAIYRGDTVDGPFTRVNESIVKARNEGDGITASYQWRDTGAIKGKEYWYYITIFNNNGSKTPLTGPQKVVAK